MASLWFAACSDDDPQGLQPDETPMLVVVYPIDGLGDRSYVDNIYRGVEKAALQYGLKVQHLMPYSYEEETAYIENFMQSEAGLPPLLFRFCRIFRSSILLTSRNIIYLCPRKAAVADRLPETSIIQTNAMKKIVFIIGSLRKESFNRKLAEAAEQLLAGRAIVEYLDYTDVPWLNQDIEFPAPEAVCSVREKVAEADALWIFSPEYNYSYPGHLKNLIDWLSRPLVPGDRKTPLAINGKKVALSGAGGAAATAKCREKLTELLTLPFIRADVMAEPQTGITLNPEAWTEGRMMLTEAQKAQLQRQADAFLNYIG